MDIQKSSESLSVAASGGIILCGSRSLVWWGLGSSNVSSTSVCLYMSMYEYAHTCTCELYMAKTQTHNCWMLTEELKALPLWIRWSFLQSIWVYFSYLLPHAPGALLVQGPLEKEAKSTLSPEDPASHVGELSSTPHLSLNISAVFHAFQAKCSGAAQQSTSFPIISTPIMDQYFIIEFQANIQRNNRWWAFWVGN